ncbi:MAG: cold shock domain-containing protein [Bacteroidetes bacterium]|nr:cold shock domain-containing protein [Bacteroidota bacterium]
MAQSKDTFNKKEKEKKREKRKKEKEQRREERQANATKGKALEDMLAYVDENGNISSTPPDPNKKKQINSEDIQIGVPRREDEPAGAPRSGTVIFFNEAKGYGFIRDEKTQESIFVHATGLINPVKENDRVTFMLERGPKGMNAVSVSIV